MATFAFKQPQMMQKRYIITTADGSSVSELKWKGGRAVARISGDRQAAFTKPSLFSNKLAVAVDGRSLATYRVLSCREAAKGSIKKWLRQFFEQAGVVELDGRAYRFVKTSAITKTEYTWSLQTAPDSVVVRYHHSGLGSALKEKGTIEVVDTLPSDHMAILLPLGLFLAVKANRDNSAGDGGASSVAATI